MAHDAELDRLKVAQDNAFQRKQNAYQAQQQAWDRRTSAREDLNRAHESKQRAYAEQESSWQRVDQVRSSNGPRIDSLNSMQESAYLNMGSAFQNASAAHDRRDGAAARSYADDGHRYKAECQGYVVERRRLVEEIRSARAVHDATKPAFQRAKAEFSSAKERFDRAKADHERAQAEFKQAKAEFDAAAKAFRARLEKVRDESAKRKNDKRSIAEKAGIPYEYRNNVYVSTDASGNTNIYFGGLGSPDGPGHGHYVMNRSGDVTYMREPFDAHGSHNFTDNQSDYSERIGHEVAGQGEFGFSCRFRGYDAFVESNTNKQGQPKIDIYYGPNGPFGPGHHHAVALRSSPYDFESDLLR